jgi:hypothetical protein
MNIDEYQITQTTILLIAGIVRTMDLDGFIQAASLAESAGPIIDPTLYRLAASKLQTIKDLAYALRQFQAALPPIQGGM